MLCVAVGSILPLPSPGINSTSHPEAPDQPSARQPSPRHCSWEGHSYCWHSPRVAYTSLLSKAQLQKAPNTFCSHIFVKAAVLHLCHLFIISTNAPQSHTELWSLPPSCEITFWSLSSMAFYFSEFLYITQKQQSLASPKVSQSAFQAPSNLSWIVLSLFYRCK